MAYGQSEAPEATWADAAVSEGVSAALTFASPGTLARLHMCPAGRWLA